MHIAPHHAPVPERRDGLPMLEAALLWSMRAWVLGQVRGIAVDDRLQAVFAGLRATAAVEPLDGLMWVLSQGASRTLDIACVCNPAVSADETTLLDVLALEQEARPDDATVLLGRLVNRAAAGIGRGCAGRLVAAVNAAGHRLPRAGIALRRHAFAGSVSGLPGSARLH